MKFWLKVLLEIGWNNMIKKLIAHLAGKRGPIEIELDRIDSILLKPIGDAIGDAVAHTAHLHQLKKANPKVKIGVIVTNRNRDLFYHSGLVDQLVEDKFSSYFCERNKWDLYLDFQPTYTTKSIIQEIILSPKKIIVFNKKYKKYYNLDSVKNYNFACVQSESSHISDYLNNSVINKWLSPDSAVYQLNQPKLDVNYDEIWGHKVRILLAPFGSARKIPLKEIIELISLIDEKKLKKVKIILTNTIGSQLYLDELKKVVKNLDITVSPPTTILQYIGLVASSDIVISVDSGTVHIAAALKKKIISFYARNMSNFYRWKPKISYDIPYKAILSKTESESNNNTFDFPMDEAADWLNHQLKDIH